MVFSLLQVIFAIERVVISALGSISRFVKREKEEKRNYYAYHMYRKQE